MPRRFLGLPFPTSPCRPLFVWAAILSLFFDQISKLVVHGTLYMSSSGVRVLGDVVRFVYERNQHGVFGWEYGPKVVYLLLPVMGSALVLLFGLRTKSSWLATAFGLVLGGALGNLIDRIRLGYVIDFIVVELPRLGFRWYTFNLADAFLVIGVIMLLGYELFGSRKEKGQSEKPAVLESQGKNVSDREGDGAAGLP